MVGRPPNAIHLLLSRKYAVAMGVKKEKKKKQRRYPVRKTLRLKHYVSACVKLHRPNFKPVKKNLHLISQYAHAVKKKRRRRKKRSILLSLWAIASMAVNRVTVRSRYNYKRCLHIAATHLLLKSWCWEVYGARLEKGATCPGRARKVKLSIWLTLSPQQAHGTALGQALGAAAASADRAQPHVAPYKNTAPYWQ